MYILIGKNTESNIIIQREKNTFNALIADIKLHGFDDEQIFQIISITNTGD